MKKEKSPNNSNTKSTTFKIDLNQILAQLIGGIITLVVAFGVLYTSRHFEDRDNVIKRNNELIRNMRLFTSYSIAYFENHNAMQIAQVQQKISFQRYLTMNEKSDRQTIQNTLFWLLQNNTKRVDIHEVRMNDAERRLEEIIANIEVIESQNYYSLQSDVRNQLDSTMHEFFSELNKKRLDLLFDYIELMKKDKLNDSIVDDFEDSLAIQKKDIEQYGKTFINKVIELLPQD